MGDNNKQVDYSSEHVFSPVEAVAAVVESAKKFDSGKPSFTAIPLKALEEVVKVGTMGADKYGKYNYLSGEGLEFSRLIDAMHRHSISQWWNQGEELDKESGLPHLAHAAFNLLMLLEYRLRCLGKDDRPLLQTSNVLKMSVQCQMQQDTMSPIRLPSKL